MASSLLLLLLLLQLQDSSCSFPPVSFDTVVVRRGEAVRLNTSLTRDERNLLHDLQWQLPKGQWEINRTGSGAERRRLLADGSLSFSRTETEDTGRYLMRAFDKDGNRIRNKEIFLQVNSGESRPSLTSDL